MNEFRDQEEHTNPLSESEGPAYMRPPTSRDRERSSDDAEPREVRTAEDNKAAEAPHDKTNDELLIAVAEKMGWAKLVSDNDWSPMAWKWVSPAGVIATPAKSDTHLPPFTTSTDAALTLCDALKKEGWNADLEQTAGISGWDVTFWRVKGETVIDCKVSAPTLPLAICRAFMAVKGETIA